ncbi:probable cyclic nucleotide-gated ion channel 20, chloroplastic [Phoenix dactylifera]|uniref:Probable cyclic nucleotide-gated ion channel 20, chloroplastic n=1 Tax=Phoenix dactylifera TaxID=42345 RepID=A0A8B9AKZ5_PHODC|nr:probable cyclic nucleotide-gated ion channel 20, chloroplastic [Phoenix dactylifera]XP_038987402.1 probable cyclic nucleotide-gated ion channel 20, chloroplastic [Phoenix dactylifera]
MADQDKDHIPMLSKDIKLQKITARSASMSMPPNVSYESEDTFISHTGPLRIQRTTQFAPTSGPLCGNQKVDEVPWLKHGKQHAKIHAVMPEVMGQNGWSDNNHHTKNEHLLKSGPLGLCNDPDCTDCPAAYKTKRSYYKNSVSLDSKLRNILYGEADGWAKKSISCLSSYLPVMNPHTKVVQQWNKFFVISCLIAIFVDPLFFFVLSVQKEQKCIVLNWSFATALAVVRSVTDFIYLLHMLLQFRLAYVAPESRVVGAGDLVDQPKKIALHYLRGFFIIDVFIVLPLPQVMILLVIPKYVGSSAANYAKNLLRATVLLQYAPRIARFLPLLVGQSASGFIFESAWANFVINLLMFMLASHVVGSSWYLFGLQRVNQCLRDACSSSSLFPSCASYIDCGRGNIVEQNDTNKTNWLNDYTSSDCFNGSGGHFAYGIYQLAVLLTTERSIVTRYIYSSFWGFQQISTLAGNLEPSYFVWEVLFTMAIIGLGLLLFALLIGNMQNFLQALGRRRLEMQLRRRDVERWMSHRRLPEYLKRQVRQAERFSWAATRGVNEEELLENLPEDIQREIRRHFFKFLHKVRIFSLMDEPLFDAVCEKLRQKLYIRGSDILYVGSPVEKMVFIVRGKLESIGADGNVAPLSEGDVCGEELLTWYLEHSSVNRDGGKIRFPGQLLFSNRTVKCLTNVEAFALRAADLEEVTTLFSRFLRSPRVQGAIRYESPYWRNIAATRIQVVWRYRQRRLKRNESSNNGSTHSRSHVWRQWSSDSAKQISHF